MIKKKYKIGDNIIELGKVFRIFKIGREKNNDGQYERVIYFKPYFDDKLSKGLTCSIPVKNINRANIRKPINKKMLSELLLKLKKSRIALNISQIAELKKYLNSSDPSDTVELIKLLYKEKKNKPDNFSSNKKYMLNLSLDKIVQEFALVGRVSLEKARENINLALGG
jgi:RNA polymerase-interacting CarD/CdnL/TRCF family regulator